MIAPRVSNVEGIIGTVGLRGGVGMEGTFTLALLEKFVVVKDVSTLESALLEKSLLEDVVTV